VGNRLLPRSLAVYALKRAGQAGRPVGPLGGRAR